MRVRFADAAPVLLEQGWGTPVPSDPESKRPLLPNWSRYCTEIATPQKIAWWCEQWPDANTAIAVSPAAGVVYFDFDFDLAGPAMVARSAANEHLGHTTHIRVGRDPRQVRMYRVGPRVDDFVRPGLEIMTGASPTLITLFGTHPGTGLPYIWPDQHPLDTEPGDLPEVDTAMVAAFLDAMRPFVGARGSGVGAGFEEQPAAPLLSAIADNPDIPPLELLASALAGAMEGGRHFIMFGAVVAAVMRGFTDEEVTAALLPVHEALHPERERRAARVDFRGALHWIRKRHGPDRHGVREMLKTAPPWIKMARGQG